MKILDLVPGWVWAVLVGVLVGVAGFSYVRMKHAQAELATYRAEVAENTQRAEAQARETEQKLRRQAERIAQDAAKRQTALAANVATSNLAAGELRDEIARLNARDATPGAELASIVGETRTARELLGACAAEYRGVAQAADELRDQVIGLQDFAQTACRAGEVPK